MPSPLLHTAAGAGICLLDPYARERLRWWFVAPVMLAAVLPDLDVLPGLMIGAPNRFHSTWSHSLGFGVIAAGLVAMTSRRLRWRVACWVFVSWGLHCLLDSMNQDGRAPYGVPLLWPLSTQAMQAPWQLFTGFGHGGDGTTSTEFISAVFSRDNLPTLLREAVIGFCWILVCFLIGQFVKHVGSGASRQQSSQDSSM